MLAAERGGKLTNGMRNIRRTLTEAISAILVNLQRFKVWSRWVLRWDEKVDPRSRMALSYR